ncbi:S-adenosyl-L-methionine-dependent methyltransferase [Peniophora sp. CONT]|nr:S-adenosyl-L-methionine-dependent methyltransferase [Peniophora sp. CONT]
MCSKCGHDHPLSTGSPAQPHSSAVHDHAHGQIHSHAHHHHHHHHHHGAPANAAEMNAEYYDREAANYESMPGARELLKDISVKMRESATFNESSTRVLDFASGIGMLSRELAPYSKAILGVDISPVSVAIYNHKAEGLGAAHKMRAVSLDLQKTEGELPGQTFDVVVCSMAWHHFDDPDAYAEILTRFLAPGGKLLVVDHMGKPTDEGALPMPDSLKGVVPQVHGFSEERIKSSFELAGLVEVRYNKAFRVPLPIPDMPHLTEEERTFDLFLAEGTRPGQKL